MRRGHRRVESDGIDCRCLNKSRARRLADSDLLPKAQVAAHGKLLEEIEKLSLFDGDIKERLQMTVTEGCGCETARAVDMNNITREAGNLPFRKQL